MTVGNIILICVAVWVIAVFFDMFPNYNLVFNVLFGKVKEHKKFHNVGKANIKIIDINDVVHILPISGCKYIETYFSDIPRSIERIRTVGTVFSDFVKEANKGMVQVGEDCFVERNQIKSICLTDQEDFEVYTTYKKRSKN